MFYPGYWDPASKFLQTLCLCMWLYTRLSTYSTYIWTVLVHTCMLLLTELPFRDTVSFHFTAWLVNNCLCGWYDVCHSRRSFSAFLCACVRLVVILLLSFNHDKYAAKHNWFPSLIGVCTLTVYMINTHAGLQICVHLQPFMCRVIWVEHTRLICT